MRWDQRHSYDANSRSFCLLRTSRAWLRVCRIDQQCFQRLSACCFQRCRYIGMDACWMVKNARDNVTGQQIVNPEKFPGGLSKSVDHIHSLGLKVGIYTAAATSTCGGGTPTGSCKKEFLDAKTYSAWNIDCKQTNQHDGLVFNWLLSVCIAYRCERRPVRKLSWPYYPGELSCNGRSNCRSTEIHGSDG